MFESLPIVICLWAGPCLSLFNTHRCETTSDEVPIGFSRLFKCGGLTYRYMSSLVLSTSLASLSVLIPTVNTDQRGASTKNK